MKHLIMEIHGTYFLGSMSKENLLLSNRIGQKHNIGLENLQYIGQLPK